MTRQEESEYLDRAAMEVMKIYIGVKPPSSHNDSMRISRIAYKQALAMLDMKKQVPELKREMGLIKKAHEENDKVKETSRIR